jgi:hypothetical protein
MTRQLLTSYIDQVGITDASIMFHRHPITQERWRDGIVDIPQDVAKWLAAWADRAWRGSYTPEQLARIEAIANSKGVELDERTAAELWEKAARFESSTCPVR